jgi:hypothetical protein
MSEDLTTKVSDAIATVMRQHDGSVPLRWFMVTECMENDGSMSISMGNSVGMMNWEILGMAAYAHQLVQATVMHRVLKDDE